MSDTSTIDTPSRQTGAFTPGAFVWHEIRTPDMATAKAFYTALFGWTLTDAEMPGAEYYLIQNGTKQIGGLFKLEDDMPAHVGSFISVPDVDAAAATVVAAGGQVCLGPMDIPGIGRFAQILDPQGAFVALYRDLKGDPDTADTQNHDFCWDQLQTPDLDGAAAFYHRVVGWTADRPAPDMGIFRMGELMEASFGPAPDGVPPNWLTLIAVADLAAQTAKAESLGATILAADVPAGPYGRYSVVQDPTGAVFGLFQGNER